MKTADVEGREIVGDVCNTVTSYFLFRGVTFATSLASDLEVSKKELAYFNIHNLSKSQDNEN